MISSVILLICALALLVRSIRMLNQMGPKTSHLLRILYLITACAGLSLLLMLPELPPDFPWFKTWVMAGATVLFLSLQPLLMESLKATGDDHHVHF